MVNEKPIVAAFDFDGTLTKRDSFPLFLIFSKGYLYTFLLFLYYTPKIISSKLRGKELGSIKEKMLGKAFRGMEITKFDEICKDFASASPNLLNGPAIQAFNTHQKPGHQIVIVTASLVNWVKPFFTESITVLGTELEIKDNLITGKFKSGNCYGLKKKDIFLSLFPNRQNYILYYYGDSKGDKEMLEFADSPINLKHH